MPVLHEFVKRDFQTDWDKVGFVISLLTGPAVRLDTPFLTRLILGDFDFAGFCAQLKCKFEDPEKLQTTKRHLQELIQVAEVG